jgi:Ca2+-transporting ATPase
MGAGGTAAAREVADVVLLDDDLGTMIAAIEQGRTIYDDIKKAVHFILSTNLSEILLMFGAIAAGLGQPLTPMQLLWINMFTDIFPELALALEPPESDVLLRPPRPAGLPMFAPADLRRIAVEGAVVTSGAAMAYGVGLSRYGIGPKASSLAFTSLTCAQLLHTLSARSERTTVADERRARNKYLPPVLGASFGMQLLASVTPSIRGLLGTVPLGLFDWALVGVAAVAPLLVNEVLKVWRRSAEPEPSALPEAIHR